MNKTRRHSPSASTAKATRAESVAKKVGLRPLKPGEKRRGRRKRQARDVQRGVLVIKPASRKNGKAQNGLKNAVKSKPKQLEPAGPMNAGRQEVKG